MATSSTNDARINFRLPAKLKPTIEEAATLSGQSVSDFAVSTLMENAHRVIEAHDYTRLSNRDRSVFLQLLDDADAEPTPALVAAAKRYKKSTG